MLIMGPPDKVGSEPLPTTSSAKCLPDPQQKQQLPRLVCLYLLYAQFYRN